MPPIISDFAGDVVRANFMRPNKTAMHSFTQSDLDLLRLDLTIRAKNGLNFIVAAFVVWLLITYIWTLPYTVGTRGALTFYAGGLMLPLAWAFSKLMRHQLEYA